jgi:hypothetical protein
MRASLVLLLCVAFAGCAQLNSVATNVRDAATNVASYLPRDVLFADREEETAQLQRQFHRRKAAIEQKALEGEITWYQAAREVRNLHRRTAWSFDKADEEYHTYTATIAEEVDAGRLTLAEYNALRTQRFRELQRRIARQ